MLNNIKSVVISLILLCASPFCYAAQAQVDEIIDETVIADGGIAVGTINDPYSFEISGVLKVDQRSYFGDTTKTNWPSTDAGSYNSGAFIRDLGITFDGGVGKDYTYTIALNFMARSNLVRVDDAFITYNGFSYLMPNFSFSIGQVVPGFCISCATSSKWIPFLERSMGTNVFGPQQGLGVSATTYDNNYSLTLAITQQPKTGVPVLNPAGQVILKRDLWQGAGRFTFAPISQPGKVLQAGFSAHIQEYNNTGLQFIAVPEMRSGNSITLLNTTSTTGTSVSGATKTLISARNQKTIDFEMLGIHGPWSGELEYQKVWVERGTVNGVLQGPNLTFNGYHAQASYVLTGEHRPLKKSNGTLGQIKPKSKCGAWEVSGRYSFITLNDKDISGGMAHNTSASLSWYANNNIRVIGEYVYSKQSRQFPTYLDKRILSSIGLRLQVVF